ncbi:MAG: 3-dehydroquinate synthase [Proteobacteria bacterium]|nr:3-dehydroquinate synthase [Burkholderiales bacterium]
MNAAVGRQTIEVALGERSYPILIGPGVADDPALIATHLSARRAALVTSEIVAALYLAPVSAALARAGIETVPIVLPDGERHKNWETLNRVFDQLIEARCDRQTPVIALGGGVIGDLAGFAAATWQRGVPFVQIPTTLLAQVDSSVGGKTAINHPQGKNMIGAFHQPRLVLADTAMLSTLPERELSAGLAEVIKYGLIRDAAFLDWLEANLPRLLERNPDALAYAVRRSCEHKAEVVAADEREAGVRETLNLGHTFGHAIETGVGYGTWLHGEAIAAGTVMAAEMSARLGWLGEADVARVRRLFAQARLPVDAPAMAQTQWLELMGHDKKVRDGRIRLVLLRALGSAVVTGDYPADALKATLADCATTAGDPASAPVRHG